MQSKGRLVTYLLAALFVAATGAALYWHGKAAGVQSQNKTLAAENARLKAPIQQGKPSAVNNQSKLPEALQLVTEFYGKYAGSTGAEGSTKAALIKQYGTVNLAFYNQYYQHGFDNILCAQMKPARISVSGNTVANNVATTTVTETYDSGDKTITVRVVDQGGLKIDSVSCPGSQGGLAPSPGMN